MNGFGVTQGPADKEDPGYRLPADAPVIHVRGIAYKGTVEITTRPTERPALRRFPSQRLIGPPSASLAGSLAHRADWTRTGRRPGGTESGRDGVPARRVVLGTSIRWSAYRAGHGMMSAVTWKAPDVERPEGPLTGPERPMLQAFLDWHRATLLYKCAGLTGEQLAERTVPPSGLSLLGLVRHMTEIERVWFRQRFAGEPVEHPFGGGKPADFERVEPALATADYARLTEEFKLADAAVANASLDDTFTHNNGLMSPRLNYLHMIEED